MAIKHKYSNLIDVDNESYHFSVDPEEWYECCLEKYLENCACDAIENLLETNSLPLDPEKYTDEEKAIINEVAGQMQLGEIWQKAATNQQE